VRLQHHEEPLDAAQAFGLGYLYPRAVSEIDVALFDDPPLLTWIPCCKRVSAVPSPWRTPSFPGSIFETRTGNNSSLMPIFSLFLPGLAPLPSKRQKVRCPECPGLGSSGPGAHARPARAESILLAAPRTIIRLDGAGRSGALPALCRSEG
jgi:hypothetical protein